MFISKASNNNNKMNVFGNNEFVNSGSEVIIPLLIN